jgi:hypothetical protein
MGTEAEMKRVMVLMMALVLVATAVYAGNKKRGGGNVDLSTVRTVTGPVTAVAMDFGLGHPGFTMTTSQEGPLTVNLGPYFYLVANNFSLAVGDQVSAKVATCKNGVVAFEVTDLTSGKQIILRGEDGLPLWTGGNKGNGGQGGSQGGQHKNGCRLGGYGAGLSVDLSTLTTLEGTLTALGAGVGTHNNTVTIQTAGEAYAISMGPYWYMVQEGFVLQLGETLQVRMAQCQGHWAAFSVTRPSTGETLQLRDDQGVPLWLD